MIIQLRDPYIEKRKIELCEFCGDAIYHKDIDTSGYSLCECRNKDISILRLNPINLNTVVISSEFGPSNRIETI